MKKHIIGAIIFSLIVGSSMVIAGLFTAVPDVKSVNVVEDNNYVFKKKKKKRRCRKRRSHHSENTVASVKIAQAVFNLKTQELNTEFLFERTDDSVETVNVALNFFVDDQYGTRYLATEYVTVSPKFNVGQTALKSNTSSYRWLTNLQSRENLYVIPEVTREANTYGNGPSVFDPNKATPIVISP